MPDWQELVRQRLAGLSLDLGEKEEVCKELAGHLEETHECLRKEGLREPDAMQRTLAQVGDWRDLLRRILIAKRKGHLMKKRLQQLWIPGFLTLILSMLVLAAFQKLGFQPRIAVSRPNTVFFYVPWLLSLPFFGALATYLSFRAGGSRRTALLASVFPVLALTGAFLSMFPIGLLIERIIGSQGDFSIVATVLLRDGIGWLLIPGVALLAGGVLVHLLLSLRSSSGETAIG